MIWMMVAPVDNFFDHARRAFKDAPLTTIVMLALMIVITIVYALDAIHAW